VRADRSSHLHQPDHRRPPAEFNVGRFDRDGRNPQPSSAREEATEGEPHIQRLVERHRGRNTHSMVGVNPEPHKKGSYPVPDSQGRVHDIVLFIQQERELFLWLSGG